VTPTAIAINNESYDPVVDFGDILESWSIGTILKFVARDDSRIFKYFNITAVLPLKSGFENYSVSQIETSQSPHIPSIGDEFALMSVGGSAGSSGTVLSPVPNAGIEIASGTTGNTISTTYNTALTGDLETPEDVGGIIAGTSVADLTGKTLVDLWNDLLFPTVQPTYTIPTITIGGVTTSTLEVGSTYAPNITAYGEKNDAAAFTRLRILRDSSPIFTNTGLTQSSITNIADQFGYADPNNPNYRYTINPTPYNESYVLPVGTTTYQNDGNYGAGVAKQDNKGVFDVRSAAVRSVNAPQLGDTNFGSATRTITAIYPFFYGDMASLPTAGSIATAIQAGTETKVLSSASGTVATPYNVTGRYIWVAYLSSYTSKTVWWVTDFDSADIDGSFITTAVTQAVTSPDGYWSGINFKMHWSVYATTQTSGTFEYRNS